MTENVNKVLCCLTEKRLSDKRSGSINPGWMTVRDIAAQCNIERVGMATGCVVALMNKGVLEADEDSTLDGKVHRYYRVRDDANLTVSYSFKDELVAKREIVW
ncbi:MAG: hypothetical protein IKU15_03645 [Clostridia bacterium]|nr:hypothetical protein [Clostridia bacterium]